MTTKLDEVRLQIAEYELRLVRYDTELAHLVERSDWLEERRELASERHAVLEDTLEELVVETYPEYFARDPGLSCQSGNGCPLCSPDSY